MAQRLLTSLHRISNPRLSKPAFKYATRLQWRGISQNNAFLYISEEVREAVHSKKPVVALETTIYTHGYPYPENIALASHLESIVRTNGGVPATIGILDGVATVGLSSEDIIRLASSAGQPNTLKLSRRDLSYVCGMRLAGKNFNGGTTIAGTMVLAHLAGIKVFATGGLGGVHRGAESSMDISADLTELGRTPVTVISSGCKSFLDIPRTLEYLETEGVGVATFADGREGNVDFPAFWSRESGVKSPMTLKDEKEAAAIIYAHTTLPLSSGLHFANPIPIAASIPKSEMDLIIAEAIKQADESGATGNNNTPFILAKIKELSGGKSLKANKELITSNVERGTKVAKELVSLEKGGLPPLSGLRSSKMNVFIPLDLLPNTQGNDPAVPKLQSVIEVSAISKRPMTVAEVVVAGALAVDLACDYVPHPVSTAPLSPQMHTSNPANINSSIGGVAHNIAKAAHLMGSTVRLCSVVGDDLSGQAAMSQLTAHGMDTAGIKVLHPSTGQRTAQYVAVNDVQKNLIIAMADMKILESQYAEFNVNWGADLIKSSPKWLVVDANWKPPTLFAWLRAGKASGAMTVFEPVSVAKSTRLISSTSKVDPKTLPHAAEGKLGVFPNHYVDVATPNALELEAMHAAARRESLFDSQEWWRVIDALGIPSSGARNKFVQATSAKLVDQGIPQQCIQLLPFMPTILTKLGEQGVLLTMLMADGDARLRDPNSLPYILSRRMNDDDSSGVGGVYMRLFPAAENLDPGEVVSVNGAGDTFLGVLVAALATEPGSIEDMVMNAQKAAVLTLKSEDSVSPLIKDLRKLSFRVA